MWEKFPYYYGITYISAINADIYTINKSYKRLMLFFALFDLVCLAQRKKIDTVNSEQTSNSNITMSIEEVSALT